ncbi:MAG: sulfurtransferase TusA family protein [Fibrobacter sp.]|nr:sulfurtransferase TusA family protein [Fibrobacter sp.]MBR5693433.1 sulfurtransferase TusA family protein [Fibrobacter sp.]
MDKSPIAKWIEANSGKETFGNALRQLVSLACVEWIRRSGGGLLPPEEALSRVLLAHACDGPLDEWLEDPAAHSGEIAAFCESLKSRPLPAELAGDAPSVLDLRGVACPRNAVRSRLVMAGYPCGKVLEIWLDNGSPIENVPGSLVADGHKVLNREKKADYWVLKVVKPDNKE